MVLNVEKQSFAICWVLWKLVLEPHTPPAGGAIHNMLQINGIWGGALSSKG